MWRGKNITSVAVRNTTYHILYLCSGPPEEKRLRGVISYHVFLSLQMNIHRKLGIDSLPKMVTAGAMTLIVIAVIIYTIILLVTCFKRQVERMKDRSKRDPHIPGSEAKKVGTW